MHRKNVRNGLDSVLNRLFLPPIQTGDVWTFCGMTHMVHCPFWSPKTMSNHIGRYAAKLKNMHNNA